MSETFVILRSRVKMSSCLKKRLRTDLLDIDEGSDIGASEVEDDDPEDILGQPEHFIFTKDLDFADN